MCVFLPSKLPSPEDLKSPRADPGLAGGGGSIHLNFWASWDGMDEGLRVITSVI